MITVQVLVDEQEVGTTSAKSRWELPDVVAKLTRSYDQSSDYVWDREERVKDASGELLMVIVRYHTQKAELSKAS